MIGLSQLEFRILDGFANTFQSEFLDMLAPKISFLADGGWLWILFAVLLLLKKRTRKTGLTITLALLLSMLVANIILKPVVARIRPFHVNPNIRLLIPAPSDYSFPSGHTQASFAAATAMYCNIKYLGIAALLLAGLIGFSRLYLYVHYVSDVLAGALIGYGLGCLSNSLIGELRYMYNAKKRKRRK